MTELALKIEANMRRFDKTQKGKLTVDDIYNVVKVGLTSKNTKNLSTAISGVQTAQLRTPFSGLVFCALSHNLIRFVLNPRNVTLTGQDSLWYGYTKTR